MKRTFALVATLSLLTLTACGGGGGSDSPVSVNQPSNGGSPVVNPSTPTTNGFVVSGKAIKFENGKQTGTVNSQFHDGELLVRVEGKEIWFSEYKGTEKYMVYVYDEANKKYTDKPDHYTGRLQYATFGLLYQYTNPNNPTTYLYYTGKHNATKDMPNTGTAHYVGAVFAYRPSDNKTVFSDESFYSSKYPNLYDGVKQDPITFDVDFGQRTVKGTINKLRPFDDHYGEQIKNIKLSAKINGNTFSGTANGVSTEGVFVRPTAVEMTGLFKDDNNKIQGAFGARQQGK